MPFLSRAIESCLREGGLEARQLDYVGFYDKPFLKFERLLETYLSYAPLGFRSFAKAMPLWLRQKLHLLRELRCGAGRTTKRFSPIKSPRAFARQGWKVDMLAFMRPKTVNTRSRRSHRERIGTATPTCISLPGCMNAASL